MANRVATVRLDGRRWSHRRRLARSAAAALLVIAWASGGRAAAPATVAAAVIPADFPAFDSSLGRDVEAKLACTPKHWRQIAPAVHHLTTQHAAVLAEMNEQDRLAAVVSLAEFIDATRKAATATPVLAQGRTVIGLLDPAQGLGPREITAIADAYGCQSTIFKQQKADETLETVGTAFLEAITAAVRAGDPTTVVVLGHGLPTEIQSYHIRFERLAAAVLDGAGNTGPIDLSRIVIICDDCFSADFHINLLDELTREAARRGRPLASLPVCIAGTNRACVGHADVGEKFVPHFWRDVIELCFIRRPLPEAVTLGDFLEKVDNMMYGYGRAPIVEDGHVSGYRLVDPEMVQDPVVFVPLDEAGLATLRTILGLPVDAELPRWLDAG